MTRLAACLALFFATPALADTALPALHDVKGVAANDVLNIRAEPDGAAPILGGLAPDQTAVEIVALSPNGKWGRVNLDEASGWVSMTYLARQPIPVWHAMQTSLACFGTEPFWSATIDPQMTNKLRYGSPDQADLDMDILALWPGEDWRPVAGVTFAAADATGMAVIRAEACNDGMSDRAYGLSVDLFVNRNMGGDSSALRGCCSISP